MQTVHEHYEFMKDYLRGKHDALVIFQPLHADGMHSGCQHDHGECRANVYCPDTQPFTPGILLRRLGGGICTCRNVGAGQASSSFRQAEETAFGKEVCRSTGRVCISQSWLVKRNLNQLYESLLEKQMLALKLPSQLRQACFRLFPLRCKVPSAEILPALQWQCCTWLFGACRIQGFCIGRTQERHGAHQQCVMAQ
jgi:hypothetical protein